MDYILTEEGKKYAKEGTPEMLLAKLLKKHPMSMDEARKNLENFSIALQWLKKYDAVEIKEGMLFLKKEPREMGEIKNTLEKIARGHAPDGSYVSTLLQRKLISEQRETMEKRAERFVGKEITNLTEELIKTGTWKKVILRPYNVTVRGRKINMGKRHPYNVFLQSVRRKLVEMGFVEMKGPLVETEFWNFDALFQPQNHPSRDWTQTYSLKHPKRGFLPDKEFVSYVKESHENGWKTGSTGWGYKWDAEKAKALMPRAHGTALSARTLAANPSVPGKYFAIGRCYRPDVIDATHGIEFNQTEGIIIEEDINMKSLIGVLKQFALEFAGADKIKFLPDYYPFTEPSVQMSAKHPELGWIELGGAGIFREELTKPLGVEVPVIAWGIGIDRLAMYKLGIRDIRELFSRNLEWLRNVVI